MFRSMDRATAGRIRAAFHGGAAPVAMLAMTGAVWLAVVVATVASPAQPWGDRGAIAWVGVPVLLALFGAWLGRVARGGGPAPAPDRPATVGYSLRLLLNLLVLATALPLLLLLGYHMVRGARLEVDQARQLVRSLAQVTATDTAAALTEAERFARTLAEKPLVRTLDPAHCDPALQDLLKLNHHFVNVATANAAGDTVCSVLDPPGGTRPNIRAAPWFRRVLAGNAFVIGNPQKGLFTGRWVAPTGYPIRNDRGEAIGSVGTVINLAAFEPVVRTVLPADGVAAVVDGDGYLIARSERAEEFVGRRVRDTPIGRAIFDAGLREEVNVGAGGIERFYAYVPVGRSGWFAIAGVPTELIYAEARASAWRNGLIGLAVILAAAYLVLVIHRRIAGPMHSLVAAAQRVADGQLDQRAPEAGPREVAEVAVGFNRMLDAIPLIESELRRSEEQYRTLFDATPEAIRVVCDGVVVMANPACLRLFGLASEAGMRDQPVLDSVAPEYHDLVRSRIEEALSRGHLTPRAELELQRADGTRIPVETAVLPFAFRGRPAVLAIIHDLTERKAAELAMRRLNAELETRVQERTAELSRVNKALEGFAYTMAHDLRSPLRAIVGFSALLRDAHAERLDDDAQALLGRISSSAESMSGLIEGLLAIARLERITPEVSVVDLSGQAEAIVTELRAREPQRRVDVRIAPGLVALADRSLIGNVLDNLIGNAWKFTAATPAARIEFGARADGAATVYFVRDNGAGFDPRHVNQLFQTFHRLHPVAQFPGTGIGLASVRRIVEHHGGRVWAEGEIGLGATFFFTLEAVVVPEAPGVEVRDAQR